MDEVISHKQQIFLHNRHTGTRASHYGWIEVPTIFIQNVRYRLIYVISIPDIEPYAYQIEESEDGPPVQRQTKIIMKGHFPAARLIASHSCHILPMDHVLYIATSAHKRIV